MNAPEDAGGRNLEPSLPAADEVWPLRSARGGNTGRAHAYLAQGQSALRFPILVSEGFPGSHTQAYLLAVLDQHGLMTRMRALGYDIVVIGLDQGTDRIQNNAGVIEDCIAQVQARTPETLVAAGMSMGGLVLRYALARMERAHREHRARAYLSIDTPHRGAYTSLAAQWFAQTFRSEHAQIEQLAQLLDSPANQQLMSHWLHAGEVIESPLRREFMDELAQLGHYPQQPQRWAIASGRGDGARSLAPRQLALDWTGDGGFGARLWTLDENVAARVAEGRVRGRACTPLDYFSRWSWESAPGGQGRYLDTAALCAQALGRGAAHTPIGLSCTVPTVSALDLPLDPFIPIPPASAIASPFQAYRHDTENHPHLYFSAPTADWLLQQLGPPVSRASGRACG